MAECFGGEEEELFSETRGFVPVRQLGMVLFHLPVLVVVFKGLVICSLEVSN